jgi:hypothetical protein
MEINSSRLQLSNIINNHCKFIYISTARSSFYLFDNTFDKVLLIQHISG